MNDIRPPFLSRTSLLLFLYGLAAFRLIGAETPAVSRPAPYPASTFFQSIKWNWDTYKTAAPGSDLWPITWGPDDHLYAAWGDGGGFGGSDSDGRVSLGFARIEGDPEHFHGLNINGGKNPLHPASFPTKGKTDGLLFASGRLYASINLQDGKWPNVNHVVAWSEDKGATWNKADWLFPPGKGQFEPAKFLNFGPDYTRVPARLSGYIYLIGPAFGDGTRGRGASLYLARTPLAKIPVREAFQFFSGLNSENMPLWQPAFESARPIFTDTNGVSPGAITYLPPLNRFLLSVFHTGPGQLGIFDAPEPWGPWTTVAYYEDWGNTGSAGEGLSCEFPAKWISADGLTLWCVFAVYGDGAKKGINAHDRFNLVKVTLSR
jgi:hypothetical protein